MSNIWRTKEKNECLHYSGFGKCAVEGKVKKPGEPTVTMFSIDDLLMKIHEARNLKYTDVVERVKAWFEFNGITVED